MARDRYRRTGAYLCRVLRAGTFLLLAMLSGSGACTGSFAQAGDPAVEQAYKQALALCEEDLQSCWHLIDSLGRTDLGDRDQRERIGFLQAVTEARLDSISAMRRSVEALFRNDRNYVMKPYDPLMVVLPERDVLYTTYLSLVGGREVGSGMLQKDQGRWRAGLLGGTVLPFLDQQTQREVLDTDGPYSYTTPPGWEVSALTEYDVAHNLAIRLTGGYGVVVYRARNASVRYEERLAVMPFSLGLRKLFWMGDRSPWVPHLTGGGSLAWIASAQANVERSGDGVRLLGPKEVDRIPDRERTQFRLFGGAGVSYKVGHTVLFIEGRYEHALADLTLGNDPYRDEELLVRYYHVDNRLSLSQVVVCAGFQYVIKYHERNRIHP